MLWELDQEIDQMQEDALRRAERQQERFLQSVNDFIEGLPLI